MKINGRKIRSKSMKKRKKIRRKLRLINYKEISFSTGSSVEEAVYKLRFCKNKGKLVYINFNGHKLYSNINSIKYAYKEIIGKTKKEYVGSQRRWRDKIEKENEEHEKQIPSLEKEYIKKGKEILSEDKWKYWEEIVPIRLKDLYHGMELGACLDIIKILNENNESSFENAKKKIISQNHSGMSFSLVCVMIREFCDKGEEFEKYINE